MPLDRPLTVGKGLLGGLLLLALAVAYLLGSGAGSDAVAAPSGPSAPAVTGPDAGLAADARTLTMSGTGTANVVPDEVAFTVAVSVVRSSLDDALASTNSTLERVYRALEENGVVGKDVQTAGLSMEPVYDYHSYGPPTLRGYRVGQRASVVVRDLGDAGGAVSAAVAAGGDDVRVNGLKLQVGDPEAALEKARQAAIAEARTKAEQYAAATGQSLGDVLTLREVRGAAARPQTLTYDRVAAGLAADAGAVPIRAGRDEATVRVQVVWEFGGDAR